MTSAIAAEYAADILRAFVDADIARIETCLAEAESARDAVAAGGSNDSMSFELLSAAVSSIQVLLERIEQQQLQNRRDLERSCKLLLRLTGPHYTHAQANLRLQ